MLVAGVKDGSLRFIGTVSIGGSADDDVEGVAAGVTTLEQLDVE
jgi:hypothetical protein